MSTSQFIALMIALPVLLWAIVAPSSLWAVLTGWMPRKANASRPEAGPTVLRTGAVTVIAAVLLGVGLRMWDGARPNEDEAQELASKASGMSDEVTKVALPLSAYEAEGDSVTMHAWVPDSAAGKCEVTPAVLAEDQETVRVVMALVPVEEGAAAECRVAREEVIRGKATPKVETAQVKLSHPLSGRTVTTPGPLVDAMGTITPADKDSDVPQLSDSTPRPDDSAPMKLPGSDWAPKDDPSGSQDSGSQGSGSAQDPSGSEGVSVRGYREEGNEVYVVAVVDDAAADCKPKASVEPDPRSGDIIVRVTAGPESDSCPAPPRGEPGKEVEVRVPLSSSNYTLMTEAPLVDEDGASSSPGRGSTQPLPKIERSTSST